VFLFPVLLLPLPHVRAGEKAGAPVTLPGEVLILPPASINAVWAQLAAGKWRAPKAGSTLRGVDGKDHQWQAIPFKNGKWDDPSLAGGCAWFGLTSPEDRVLILEASGNVLGLFNGEPRVGDVYQSGYVRVT